ncbi:rod shape-determining protein MreC [Phaeocystidibacter luteus]|uniref:Cell shape-determining protein MreC n=1 Tax=Phaeocystidibacter luteus TaxID=911197 RepID=A0A6N6REE7_9FLAO|nr:rod shape-determining protein MreC [Phaeocystidibacter luteus]KAB2808154.1 rod shape-determining protein MreC [Phaeocystidibacter luteus]
MQYLLQFLWKRRILFAFIAMQAVALTLVVRANSYHRTAVATSANAVTGSMMENYRYVRDFINLSQTNRNLASENATLRSALKSSYFQMYADHDTVVDTLYIQQYSFIDAEVINSSIHKRNNYLTLNRGSAHGVQPDMGVINSDGVVGIVTDVSKHYSTVIPIIHGRTSLSGRFKNAPYFGPVSWPATFGYREARWSDIPRQARIHVGDTVVTDTRSGLYPSGIPIGVVDTFYIEPQDQFYEIDVVLAVDFAALEKVYIVKNLLKGERALLEMRRNNDE